MTTQKTPSLMHSLSQGYAHLRAIDEAECDDGFDEEGVEEGEAPAAEPLEETSGDNNMPASSPNGRRRSSIQIVHDLLLSPQQPGSARKYRDEQHHYFCTDLIHNIFGEAHAGGRVLMFLPVFAQLCMLLQCLLQALLITMLGRDFLLLLSDHEASPEGKSIRPDGGKAPYLSC